MYACLLLFLVPLVFGQRVFIPTLPPTQAPIPTPCCYAPSGQSVLINAGRDDIISTATLDTYQENGMFYYDYPNRRIHIQTFDAASNTRNRVFMDYNLNKRYQLIEADGCTECRITSLNNQPMQNCIPQNATLFASPYFGVGFSRIQVDVWTFPSDNGKFTLRQAVTRSGCFVVSSNYFGTDDGVEKEQTRWFLDTKPILDTSVFIIPEICTRLEQTLLSFGTAPRQHRCVVPEHLV